MGAPAPPPSPAGPPPSGAGARPSPTAVPVLDARHVTTAVPGAAADVVVPVRPGGLTVVTGPSGCGKTTLLRALAGVRPVTGGTLALAGAATPWPVGDRTPGVVALVGQHPVHELNPARTAGAAVARPLRRLHGLSAAGARAEAVRLLGAVGLPPDVAGRRPAALSCSTRTTPSCWRSPGPPPRPPGPPPGWPARAGPTSRSPRSCGAGSGRSRGVSPVPT
ncbi:ATP-binding cassette domain-containing protein [Pseudonocardia alni]|uniref:ATP-binding cassette domain-containing protein n=1 Tax=Pseudonocardia alni TaxID=33907 RepID=UPI0036766453